MDLPPGLESPRDTQTECIARRSVSIFSRRGTSTRKPKALSLSQTVADSSQEFTNSPMHETNKQRSRMRRSKLTRQDRGTVLHAVPPETAGISMSPLEIAMATSPNEEILQAIGKISVPSTSRKSEVAGTWKENTETASRTSPVQSSINSRIGVWRDGVAFWDVVQQKRDFEDTVIYTSSPPNQMPLQMAEVTGRPNLSAIVPDSELRYALRTDSSHSRWPLLPVRVAHTTTTSKHAVPTRRTDPDPRGTVHLSSKACVSGEGQSSLHGPMQSEPNSRSSMSSNTAFQDDTFDEISCYSHHSSMTSLDAEDLDDIVENPHWNCLDVPKRSVSAAFSITSPVKAGVFDDTSRENDTRDLAGQLNSASGEQLSPAGEEYALGFAPGGSFVSGQYSDPNYVTSVGPAQPASPTLSEAVQDLQTQLSSIQEESCPTDAGSDTHTSTPDRVPTLPRRSRKRDWKSGAGSARTASTVPTQGGLPVRRQSAPSSLAKRLRDRAAQDVESVRRIASMRLTTPKDTGSTPSIVACRPNSLSNGKTSAKSCSIFSQRIICHMIMADSPTLEDLTALSAVNKMTRQVYQENEMALLKHVLYKRSPSAWELREWSLPDFGDIIQADIPTLPGYTASSYKASVRKDQRVSQELKDLILTRCQSFLRPETVCALAADGDFDTDRFDAAFYRVWCFCKIFGCEKGREADLRGQLDWLRGGTLAHQNGCGATLDFKPELDLDGILLNPPDYFAKGNLRGLSAEQLYDMAEVWDCLTTLLRGYETNIVKAQNSGVFSNVRQPLADSRMQMEVLEEWIAYILTLGPSVVLELARFAHDASDAGMEHARLNGWTDWTPPLPGTSRTGFLKEPISELYEEQLISSAVDGRELGVGKRLIRRRQRQGIGAPRTAKTSEQWPLRDDWNGGLACTLGRRDSAMAPEVYKERRRPSTPSSQVSGGWSVSPASWSPRKVSPVIEERVETFNRLSMLGLDGFADETSDRAIGKIVEMGFTASQAKDALKLTDMGNGLRVDRAVDWLLGQC